MFINYSVYKFNVAINVCMT